MTSTNRQRRLLFKLPLDKQTTIHPDPASPSTSLLILTDQNDLYYAALSGRQLKLVRKNVKGVFWITTKRFLLLDAVTHDLIFYKIETHSASADTPVQFVSILHFAFQFVSSIVLEVGLSLRHEDDLQFLNYIPRRGYLDFLVKKEYFLRIYVDSQKRLFEVVSCLKLGKELIGSADPQLTLLFHPANRKLFLISPLENEFLVALPLKEHLPTRVLSDPLLVDFSPDFRWLILVTVSLDVFQIFLPIFQSSSWNHLHKASLHAASSALRFPDDDSTADTRKTLRRVNACWEREVGDVIAKNSTKQNFTPSGWIFPNEDVADVTGWHVTHFQPPVEYADFCPLALHCTETEIYLTAKNAEGQMLLGVKQIEKDDAIWMTFAQECLITFPATSAASYPVTLFYPMSMAVIATDKETGFQRDIAEAAAPDPWEDLTENQVMEVALVQGIVDKAVDYLQRRFPDRPDLFVPDYPSLAAQAIAREYLQEHNVSSAREILNFVGVEVADLIRKIFLETRTAEYRLWLKDALTEQGILTEEDSRLLEYLTVLEAHLPNPLSVATVSAWSEGVRQERLLQAAIETKDVSLVDTFPLEFLWDCLATAGDGDRMLQWIRGESDFTDRAVSGAFCERLEGVESVESNEAVQNAFAQRGVFSHVESSDWQRYVRRLMSAFGEEHPLFQKGNVERLGALPVALRRQLLDFAVDSRLIALIMGVADEKAFLEYLKEREGQVPEWLSLLLMFRGRQLEDVGELRQLSVKNAEFCWGSDVTVLRLLELEETEVALGLICLLQNQWPPGESLFDNSDSGKCLDLLQKQISRFPKLKEALFPIPISDTDRLARSVSVYRLLHASAVYDARKLFGWQCTNTINTLYRTVEMPSFSSTDLQDKHGYKKDLDFVYYLKNARPAFACWSFISHLTADNFKDELMAGRDMAFFLALFFYLDNAVVAACVSFMEMLGIESLSTRINIQAARRIHAHRQKVFASADSADLIRDIFIELFKYGTEVANSVVEDLIDATKAAVASVGLYCASWEAASHWMLVNQFCEVFDLPLPLDYLAICAGKNEWLNFVVYCELFQYPIAVVVPLLEGFPHPHVKTSLRLVLQNVRTVKQDAHSRHEGGQETGPVNRNIRSTLYSRIGVMASDKTTSSTSDDDVKGREGVGRRHSEVRPSDMVETLCLAQKSLHPWRELLGYAVEFRSPIYAMIASGEPGADRIACLAVILFTGLVDEDMVRYRSDEDLPASLSDFHWTRRHIETLIHLHTALHQLPLVHIALSLVAQDSLIEQLTAVAAGVAEREEGSVITQKLKKLTDTLQRVFQTMSERVSQTKADRVSQTMSEKGKEDVEDVRWALVFGLSVWADLLTRLRGVNELEWRGVLQMLKDSGVLLYVVKMRKETDAPLPDAVDRLIQDVALLSQSVQVDATRLMELKSLLRDFQKSSLWKTEAFRMEVWQSIFGRVHVELTEKQSTDELIDILRVATTSSTSVTEKCVLSTIIWRLDDTEEHFRLAWEAKVSFGLTTSLPLEDWMADVLMGAGSPTADLQREILSLGAMSLASFEPSTPTPSGVSEGSSRGERGERDVMVEGIIAVLLKQGNLALAARLSLVFGYLHADLDAICTALALARWDIDVSKVPGWIVTAVEGPSRKRSITITRSHALSNGGEVEFEDDVVVWLRKIAGICTLGADVVTAIMDNYCFAKFLQVGFEDMLRFTTRQVLERLFAMPSLDHLTLAKRCLVSFKANSLEVTAFVSGYVIEMLQRGLATPHADPKAVGDSIKPYLGVAIDLTSLGNHLIDAATDTPPDSSMGLGLGLRVEILIAAHEVLTRAGVSGVLEGISRLLSACKGVSQALSQAGDYHSLIRLLNGIGRYSDLTFIFHQMKEADKMEMLFSRGVEKDPKLKNAILNYLRKFHADDGNTLEMLAAAYSMHREIAETFLGIAQDKMGLFKHRPIVDTQETQGELRRIAQFLMDAANSFSRAECYSRTEKCIEQARLVALQIVFLPTGLRLLSLNNPSGFVSTHPRFAEAFIYAQAYGITEEWADAVYTNYVLNGDVGYLQDFLIKYEVTVQLVTEVAKKFKGDGGKPPTAVIYMKKLLRQINDVETTFRLANDLTINDLSMEMLQIDGGVFLRDVMKF